MLGRGGIEVSEAGFGCWAIGGPFTDSTSGGIPVGWREVDEVESAAALRRAYEPGVTFFDTADVYGTGHSERVLGRALAGHRDEVVIATKFGSTSDAGRRTMTGQDVSAAYIRRACQESLRRLGTDRIDLHRLHRGGLPATRAQEVAGTLEDLAAEGMIRCHGWSTDDPQRLRQPGADRAERSRPIARRKARACPARAPRGQPGILPAHHGRLLLRAAQRTRRPTTSAGQQQLSRRAEGPARWDIGPWRTLPRHGALTMTRGPNADAEQRDQTRAPRNRDPREAEAGPLVESCPGPARAPAAADVNDGPVTMSAADPAGMQDSRIWAASVLTREQVGSRAERPVREQR